MNEIKIPTVGRQVHFFPVAENDSIIRVNGVTLAPAIVIQGFDLSVNMQVFTMSGDALNVLRYSVPHKTIALEGQSYWDWPEIH
jgi:hypothetical protein